MLIEEINLFPTHTDKQSTAPLFHFLCILFTVAVILAADYINKFLQFCFLSQFSSQLRLLSINAWTVYKHAIDYTYTNVYTLCACMRNHFDGEYELQHGARAQ